MNYKVYLIYIFEDIFYSFIDVIVYAISLGILIKLLSILTPLKDWGKIKESSMASAIVLSIIFVLFTLFTVAGWYLPE